MSIRVHPWLNYFFPESSHAHAAPVRPTPHQKISPHAQPRLRLRRSLTRRARAESVRKQDAFTKYGAQARAVLEALLQKYQDEGVLSLDDPRVLQIPPLNTLGTPVQLIREFGDRSGFDKAVHELQDALYRKDAA